jgi:murein DD-endopeptidase MepM/ murein hydrolase activator NlpD
MIESQTKLPAQESGAAKGWARVRKFAGSTVAQAKARLQSLPGTEVAQRLEDSGRLARDFARRSQVKAHLTGVARWLASGVGDGPLLSRYALHLVVVLLAVGVVSIAQVSIPEVDLRLPTVATPTAAPELGEHTVTTLTTNRGGGERIANNNNGNLLLFQAPVPHTTIAERERVGVITYTVQPNDNVWAIAQGFGLSAETVLWANPTVEKSPDLLRVGQKLVIPPANGVYYTVQAGDTVESLAKKYKTTVEKVVGFEFNGLVEPYTLTPGQQILLVDGKKATPKPNYYPMTRVGSAPAGAPTGTGKFAWPAQGLLSQKFWSGHTGIDIANRTGTPIYAADAGYVVAAGRDTWGYGNQVVIDHGNGFKTRYAHLQQISVKAGQTVKKNQQIGTMGSTGRSTGPHLHFEVISGGAFRNPLGFLP